MKESSLVQKIKKAVKQQYPTAYVRKLADRFTRGLPDLIVLFQREIPETVYQQIGVLFVETKGKDGRPSALQISEQTALSNVAEGCEAIFARSVDEVLDKMSDMGAIP